MKSIVSIAVVALCSTILAGCWFYSRPVGDPNAGCQKTTYGIVTATTSNTNCSPDNAPPLPPPSNP